MSEVTKSQKVNKTKKRRRRRKHYTMLPYLTTPLIFVLISMIVVLPASFIGMNLAVKAVHRAQEVMTRDYNDIEPDYSFEASTIEDGATTLPELYPAQKIATLKCENAGLMTDVFCGINRVSLRNGVGMDGEASAFGQGGSINLYGYKSTHFNALEDVKIGDIITVESSWGIYRYEVVKVQLSSSAPEISSNEVLYLATSRDNAPFSNFDKEKLFACAKLVSGPAVEEVQNEQ